MTLSWNKNFFQRICFTLLIAFLPLVAKAITQWQIVPEQSRLTFTAIQNNAPVKGDFKKFSGEILFDPKVLNISHVHIVVNMSSVTTSYSDLTATLIAPDWLDIKLFPHAVFNASSFIKTGDNEYVANGVLTIRDKTIPIALKFVLEEYSDTKAVAKGSVIIKRLAFGIGQGEWAKTDEIKNDVKIDFVLTAVIKK